MLHRYDSFVFSFSKLNASLFTSIRTIFQPLVSQPVAMVDTAFGQMNVFVDLEQQEDRVKMVRGLVLFEDLNVHKI